MPDLESQDEPAMEQASPSQGERPIVLDPRQLNRIESVHRGVLYQHLYVANCLLRAGGPA